MYSIDVTLKYNPMPVSVQRKEEADAQSLYQSILDRMKASDVQLIELTCEKQTEKRIAFFSDQISAVILSQKNGAAAGGRVPGFFATGNPE